MTWRWRSLSVTTMSKNADFPGWHKYSNPRPIALLCGCVLGYKSRWPCYPYRSMWASVSMILAHRVKAHTCTVREKSSRQDKHPRNPQLFCLALARHLLDNVVPFIAGMDYIRQILTSIYVRFWRLYTSDSDVYVRQILTSIDVIIWRQ